MANNNNKWTYLYSALSFRRNL